MHLAELLEQFTTVLDDSENASDPAVERLAPEAYPEDTEASAEFARATRIDLLARRRADAAVVTHALAPLLATAPEDPVGNDALEEREVIIRSEDMDAWLRTLT